MVVFVLLLILNLFWKLVVLYVFEGSEDLMDFCFLLFFLLDWMVFLIEGLFLLLFFWVNERRIKIMMEVKNCIIRLFIVKLSKFMWWRNIIFYNDLWINFNILIFWCWYLIINVCLCFLEFYFGVSLILEFI